MTDKDDSIIQFTEQPSMTLPRGGINVLFRRVQVLADFLFILKAKSFVNCFGTLRQTHGIIQRQIDCFEILFHLHDGNP